MIRYLAVALVIGLAVLAEIWLVYFSGLLALVGASLGASIAVLATALVIFLRRRCAPRAKE